MTGQDAVNVAKSFNEQLGVTGVILTKLDGDTRGGAALSIRAVTNTPIKFAGSAIKQLETLGKQLDMPVFSLGDKVSPVEIAKQAIEKAKEDHHDYVLIDTAGRLHIDEELMDELEQVLVKEELTELMGGEESKIAAAKRPPTVIMMVGLQGAGKTTSTGKLANLLRKKHNRNPLLVAADIYRPQTISKIRGKGKVTEQDVKEMMREVRLALLEADVNFKVVKDFVKKVSERAVGQDVMKSLTPGQQVIKAEAMLEQYEEKLLLFKKFQERKKIFEALRKLTDGQPEAESLIDALEKLD
ncbi:hypothetical protein DT075_24850 [Bacillus licheniformis]|nr:hypothetical protein DT075_24850 [Bacillus licheniformis]